MQERCRHIAVRMLSSRGWKLVQDIKSFAQNVCAFVRQRLQTTSCFSFPTDRAIERATVNCYAQILYQSYKTRGTWRQQRAFKELWQYLYPVALYKVHDRALAQEYTQSALVTAWEKISHCKDAGSFLAWCCAILRNVIRQEFRRRFRLQKNAEGTEKWVPRELTFSELSYSDGKDINPFAVAGADSLLAPEHRQHLATEARKQLKEAIRKALASPARQTVIIEYFLNHRGFREISQMLGTSCANVHVLKSRALAQLRKDPEFLEVLCTWLPC